MLGAWVCLELLGTAVLVGLGDVCGFERFGSTQFRTFSRAKLNKSYLH